MPLLFEAFDAIAHAIGPVDGVRRVVDLGSGPGVATVALAQRFSLATVTAVDGAEQLLARVPVRATRLGVAERIDTRIADLERSLDGLTDANSVDMVWASMVLHHIVGLPRVLADMHRLLRPGGIIAIAELGSLHGTLPAGFDVGREGFVERLAEAVSVSLEEHLPPEAMSLDWPTLLTDAGFDLIEDRELAMHLPAPLDAAPRRLVLQELPIRARTTQGHLDDADREVLDALTDATNPRCVLHRDDLSLTISRRFLLGRRRW